MRLYVRDNEIEVVLSPRNVETLHAKLDMPQSARELQKQEGDYLLRVRIDVGDDVHYGNREPGPVVLW
jgi:hypothetical protein